MFDPIYLVPLGLVGYIIFIFNRLVKLRQNRKNAFSDIDVQLKQRLDLVPQLVSTVKGYAAHENEILDKVTQMRANVSPDAGVGERAKAEGALGASLMNLFAVAENYPDLKADQNFQKLQDELSDIENKIAAARRFFNNATNELNTACQQFPDLIVARIFAFHSQDYFDAPEERETLETAPNVSF